MSSCLGPGRVGGLPPANLGGASMSAGNKLLGVGLTPTKGEGQAPPKWGLGWELALVGGSWGSLSVGTGENTVCIITIYGGGGRQVLTTCYKSGPRAYNVAFPRRAGAMFRTWNCPMPRQGQGIVNK